MDTQADLSSRSGAKGSLRLPLALARLQERDPRGFALVAVVTILALLLLLVVAISSVVQVEVRAAATSKDVAIARQHAIVGLQTALGQLQQYAGKDQAVTFPATAYYPPKNVTNATGELYDLFRTAAETVTDSGSSRPSLVYKDVALNPVGERAAFEANLQSWWASNNRQPH